MIGGTERRPTPLALLDGVLFGFAGIATAWLAWLLLEAAVRPGWSSLLLIAFWLLVAYLLLPRLHRMLTLVYVPGYFIGRTRTSDGLLGDPVNLAFLGSEPQLHAVMTRAGWTRAAVLDARTAARIVWSTVRRRSYPEAPVSPLHLFDRQQDFAYQQEVAGSPSRRHHVRFWRCPEAWTLPGGFAVDWLAAGTYDRSVGLSLFTFQVTHKIARDTDEERDHLVATIAATQPAVPVGVIRDFSSGYHSRNGGGDRIRTDGHLPVLDLRDVTSTVPAEASPAPGSVRPAQIVFGALVATARAAIVTLIGVLALAGAPLSSASSASLDGPATGGVLVAVGVIDLALAVGVFTGRNSARILVMVVSVVAIGAVFIGGLATSAADPTGELSTVGLSILVLLALSSRRARDWAARERAPRDRGRRPTAPPEAAR